MKKLGCGSSEDQKRSNQINHLLHLEKKKQKVETKLLLLGKKKIAKSFKFLNHFKILFSE